MLLSAQLEVMSEVALGAWKITNAGKIHCQCQTWGARSRPGGGRSLERCSPTGAVATLNLVEALAKDQDPSALSPRPTRWRDPHSPEQGQCVQASPGGRRMQKAFQSCRWDHLQLWSLYQTECL